MFQFSEKKIKNKILDQMVNDQGTTLNSDCLAAKDLTVQNAQS